jgi:Ner family transcriptional regulator
MAPSQAPLDPRKRAIWAKNELQIAGSSFAEIARELGCSPQNVRQAMFMPNARCEDAIAAKLGLRVEFIFPERFRADGTRISKPRSLNNTGEELARNVDGREAA